MRTYFLYNKFKIRGATLTELMIATAVFGFLTLALMGILQYGTKSWRQVESRFQAEKDIRKAVLDINANLRNSDINTFNTSNSATSAGGAATWMAFATAHDFDSANIFENRLDFNLTASTAKPEWHFFALYYLYDPGTGCKNPRCPSLRAGLGAEVGCPHKILVKKWLYIDNARPGINPHPSGTSPTGSAYTQSDTTPQPVITGHQRFPLTNPQRLDNTLITAGPAGNLLGAPKAADRPAPKILTNNVMNFRVAFQAVNPGVVGGGGRGNLVGVAGAPVNSVQYTIRCFKELEASRSNVSSSALGAANSPAFKRFADKYTMQIDQAIVPLNNFTP